MPNTCCCSLLVANVKQIRIRDTARSHPDFGYLHMPSTGAETSGSRLFNTSTRLQWSLASVLYELLPSTMPLDGILSGCQIPVEDASCLEHGSSVGTTLLVV